MAEVICFASSKGGSGKTTITAAIGTFLAETGERVLLIDCDEGTHGLTLMYLDEVNSHRKKTKVAPLGTFDVSENVDLDQLRDSCVSLRENLCLLPARHIFLENDLLPIGGEFFGALERMVNLFRDDFDFILLDAQAGLSLASRAAMSPKNSDTVVLVSEYDPMSNAGIERLKARLPDELDVGRTWILLNKLLPEFVAKFSEFLSVAKYLPPIPWTADVVRAYSRRKLALDFEGGNQFTLAILAVLRGLLSGKARSHLDEWTETQTIRLKEPIEKQLADAEKVLARMEELMNKDIEMQTSIPRVLVRQFPLVATNAALVALVFFLFFWERFQYEPINSIYLFGGIPVLTLFAILAVGISFLYLMVRTIQITIKRRESLQRLAFNELGEVAKMRERVDSLRSLASSEYDDIVLSRRHTQWKV